MEKFNKSNIKFLKSRNRRKFNRSINPSKNPFSTIDQRVDRSTLCLADSKNYMEIPNLVSEKFQNLFPVNNIKIASSLRSTSESKDSQLFNNVRMMDIQ